MTAVRQKQSVLGLTAVAVAGDRAGCALGQALFAPLGCSVRRGGRVAAPIHRSQRTSAAPRALAGHCDSHRRAGAAEACQLPPVTWGNQARSRKAAEANGQYRLTAYRCIACRAGAARPAVAPQRLQLRSERAVKAHRVQTHRLQRRHCRACSRASTLATARVVSMPWSVAGVGWQRPAIMLATRVGAGALSAPRPQTPRVPPQAWRRSPPHRARWT